MIDAPDAVAAAPGFSIAIMSRRLIEVGGASAFAIGGPAFEIVYRVPACFSVRDERRTAAFSPQVFKVSLGELQPLCGF